MVGTAIWPILVNWHEHDGRVVTSQWTGLFFLSGSLRSLRNKAQSPFYSLMEMLYSTALWSLTLLEAIFDFGMLLSYSAGNAFWDFQIYTSRAGLYYSFHCSFYLSLS